MAFGISLKQFPLTARLWSFVFLSFFVSLAFFPSFGFSSPSALATSKLSPSSSKALAAIPDQLFKNVAVTDRFKDSHFIEEVIQIEPVNFENGEPLRFCLLTDIHENADFTKMAVTEANDLDCHFNVFTGDLTDLFDQSHVDRIVRELKRLKGPLLPCIGNHERMGGTYESYIRQFGLPNYAFTVDGYFFVVLDTSRGFLSPAALAWLDRIMAKGSSSKGRFIFTHVPVVDPRPEESHCLAGSSGTALEKLMVKHKVSALFSGHIHQAMDVKRLGIRHISAGIVGGRLYNLPQEGSFRQIVMVVLTDSEVEVIRYKIGAESTAWAVWTGELKMKKIYSDLLRKFKDNPTKAKGYEKRLEVLKKKFKRYEDTLAREMSLAFDKNDWLQKAMLDIREQPAMFQEELAEHLDNITSFKYDR
jgi:3',5'-cyclic AMP phosphodiesterase CpdA